MRVSKDTEGPARHQLIIPVRQLQFCGSSEGTPTLRDDSKKRPPRINNVKLVGKEGNKRTVEVLRYDRDHECYEIF